MALGTVSNSRISGNVLVLLQFRYVQHRIASNENNNVILTETVRFLDFWISGFQICVNDCGN